MNMPSQTNVIQYRHAAENLDFLKRSGNTQFSSLKRLELVDFFLFVIDIPRLRGIKAVDDIHHHRFTGAVGPDNRMYLTFSYFQVHAGKGTYLAKKHMDILKFQQDVIFF